MTRAAGPIGDYVCTRSSSTRHGILIDPADQAPEVAAKRAIAAATAGSKMVLVGGSTDTDMDNVHATVVAIKEALELVNWASSQDSEAHDSDDTIPVILFPQGAAALSPAADGITFMMLMNATGRRTARLAAARGSALGSRNKTRCAAAPPQRPCRRTATWRTGTFACRRSWRVRWSSGIPLHQVKRQLKLTHGQKATASLGVKLPSNPGQKSHLTPIEKVVISWTTS